ncbi:MAG: sigma-70 family RNA polymerase sigma factor [Cryomorphaceae bacterium]|nr:sigma-70 family RNA polymerase sigma factor [Cryomorphaceae bacterium]
MDDSALIKDCLNGNVRAQKTLFDRFAPKMLGVCMRYCKSKEQAEDVLQDGFVKVFIKLAEFKHEGSFEGWIRKIMVNTALDSLRKEMKISADVEIEFAVDKSESETVLAELSAAEIVQLISMMPDGYRVVFNLFAIEGYSHQEIADSLGITESTSKSQYSRARAYLRKKMEKEEFGR